MAAHPSGVSVTLPGFVPPLNPIRVQCPITQDINEDVNMLMKMFASVSTSGGWSPAGLRAADPSSASFLNPLYGPFL